MVLALIYALAPGSELEGLGLFDVPEDFDFDTIERDFRYEVVEPKGKYQSTYQYFDEFVEFMKPRGVRKIECAEYFL